MITVPDLKSEEWDKFWNNHIFVRLNSLLIKNGYKGVSLVPSQVLKISPRWHPSRYSQTLDCLSDGRLDLVVPLDYSELLHPITSPRNPHSLPNRINLKFRPERRLYHYSFEMFGCSYELTKESRRFRYKNPDLKTLFDVIEYLYKRMEQDKKIELENKFKLEELRKKRTDEAMEIAKAIHCSVSDEAFGAFTFVFITRSGKIKMKFRLASDGDVEDFEIEGKIKKHHFYSIIDSLRKSVPDNYGTGPVVKKRRIDLTSDIITRMAKNENIKNFEFSKIRSWKRNFDLRKGE